ncbi:MAG TPA: putative quinol monooxygenase [Dehalococcoidia bacterium]|jgi:quinol monooxygenase YgiN|nr:putative quinol monooxygenase [Dehalococcoidia bacterium]
MDMITQLTRFEALKGKELEAYTALRKMAAAVKENEPGCILYAVTRGQVNAQEIYVYEIYENGAAAEAHRRTDHLRELQASFDKFLDRAAFNVEILDEVAGFIRGPVDEMAGQMS